MGSWINPKQLKSINEISKKSNCAIFSHNLPSGGLIITVSRGKKKVILDEKGIIQK